ncbi:MAG: SapB/AmfS family lanthipeptide [Actinomycetales bacterium]
MSDILDLQNEEPDETGGEEKYSTVSYFRACYKSYISISLCMAK